MADVSPPMALLAFSATNARSFASEAELSLRTTKLGDPGVGRDVVWSEAGRHVRVLPAVGILGANASGKTNVLRAMSDMRGQVLGSFRSRDPSGGVPRAPFRLDPAVRRSPTTFDIDIVLDGVRHQYGFTIDDERVISEWAFRFPKGRAARVFEREVDQVTLGDIDRRRGRAVLDLLRPNALYLSTAASAGHPDLHPLFAWFRENLLLAETESRAIRQAMTVELLGDATRRQGVLDLLTAADLGVVDAHMREIDPEIRERLARVVAVLFEDRDEPPSIEYQDLELRLSHDGAGGPVALEPWEESHGTQVWVGLIGPVLGALASGTVLLADELDTGLHPALVSRLVALFQSSATNPRGAQLIFNAHDVSLLGDSGDRLLGRDQVWFTDKNASGASRLYPLADLGPRKDEALGRRYLAGQYGAVPILSDGDFARAVEELVTQE